MRTNNTKKRSICLRAARTGALAGSVTAMFLMSLPATAHAADRTSTVSTSQATNQAANQVAAQVAAKPKAGTPAKAGKGSKPTRRTRVTATLSALPPVVQPGTSPAAPSNAAALVATFSPATPGQKVTLERRSGRGWKVVGTASEDTWGTATFAASPGTYRASTVAVGRAWTSGTVNARSWTPEFEDTFSGTALDTSVWNDQKREHESVYAPRTCARVDPGARSVGGGVLRLGVAVDPALAGTPCTYTSNGTTGTQQYLLNSQVSTEYTRFFQHGIVAARIKPQQAKGMHSGFWLLPAGTTYVDGDAAGGTEIDIMEFFGENGRGNEAVGSHVHYYQPGWQKVSHGDLFPATRQVLGKNKSWWDEFHVFSVEWTPTEYIFRVDGREYYRETDAVSQADEYLVLSNLTSDYELDELTADELGDAAQVDWVRVFDATSIESSRRSTGRKAA